MNASKQCYPRDEAWCTGSTQIPANVHSGLNTAQKQPPHLKRCAGMPLMAPATRATETQSTGNKTYLGSDAQRTACSR